MVLSVSPPLFPSAVTSCLDQIAEELCQDPQLARIKKLLFYVCTEIWETDPQRLERLSLRILLLHLLEGCATFERFQQKVNGAAATLNKSAEYALVANGVISRFSAVYAELDQGQATTSQELYWAVAQALEAQAASSAVLARVKKLLLLTCRGTWEKAAEPLEALSLPELLQELHQIAPTAESLSSTLNQLTQALSKPDAYRQVAEMIHLALQPLYSGSTTAAATELRLDPSCSEGSTAPAAAELPNLTAEQPTRTMLRVLKPLPPVGSPKPPAQSLVLTAVQPHKVDLFGLRLEIMQDSNPYRVKILLFSLLHEPFRGDADHEALLRTHELDELLRILFLSYRQYAELDSKLRQIAVDLAKDEYMQAASTLLRAVQPYYRAPAPAASISAEPTSADPILAEPEAQTALTEITHMKVANREMTLPD